MVLNSMAILATALCFGGPTAIPTQGLIAYFDSRDASTLRVEDGRVAGWIDKTNPNIAATASGDARPQLVSHDDGIRTGVYFDGLDDRLLISSFNRAADVWTLTAVIAPYPNKGNGGVCSAAPSGGNDYDPGLNVELLGSEKGFDQVSVEGAGRIEGRLNQMKSAYPYGGYHVMTVIRDQKEIRLYVDGGFEGARPVNPARTIMDELRIGGRSYIGKELDFFHGEIAGLALFDRALNDADRSAAEGCFNVTKEECAKGEKEAAKRLEEEKKNRMIAAVVTQSWPTVNAFVKEQSSMDPEKLPIRSDLLEAIQLGVIHLNSLYDKDKDNEPFFYVNREADGTGKMRHSVEIGIPHVVGRCLLACMMAEKLADVKFPQDGLDILERYCRSSFDNPDSLNSYFDPKTGERFIEFHNMREGLYGLWALIAGRDSAWARETAHKMLVTLDSITDEDGVWSEALAKKVGMIDRCRGMCIPNQSRMIDPLLAYYDCTHDELAMKLARLYSIKALKVVYEPDGRFAPLEKSSGHVHSITSSLSGITDFAVRTQDQEMIAACRRILEVGAPEYFSSWGWGDEVFPDHPANVVSRGEINQTGDIVRTALTLGDAGFVEYYETAERFLRSMLLPTQHREKELQSILRDRPNPVDDSERDTIKRSIGGYAMQLPNDRMHPGDWPISTLDITSGAVHAMSECYAHRTVSKDGEYKVILHFDFENDDLAVKSALPKAGKLEFHAKKDVKKLSVRIPSWVDQKSIALTIAGTPAQVSVVGGFAEIGALQTGKDAVLTFDLPCKREKETVDGVGYVTTWVGNQIIEILPRGPENPLPF
jgi:hypothetical protein